MASVSFRTKLTATTSLLILAAVAGTSVFFFRLYKEDRLASTLQAELSNTARLASHVENLIRLAEVMALENVRDSREILFLYDHPCPGTGQPREGAVSEVYAAKLGELDLSPATWTESFDLFKACEKLRPRLAAVAAPPPAPDPRAFGPAPSPTPEPAAAAPRARSATIIPSRVPFMFPYLTVLLEAPGGARFAMLSLDGFSTSAASTFFLVDAKGGILWAADGDEYVKQALLDTGVGPDELARLSREALASSAPRVLEAGNEGLVSYSKAGADWAMISLSYRPAALQPVRYAMRQAILLGAGFLLLCLFFGKNIAAALSRPILELKSSAERLGQGDLEIRLPVKGDDEISAVNGAFNTMTERITALLAETKVKAELESDLKLAHRVQEMLLPPPAVQTRLHNAYSFVRTATQCGGDCWGWMELPREGAKPLFVIMIGDIVGHGTAPALLTGTVRGASSALAMWLQAEPARVAEPRHLVEYFNRVIFEAAKGTMTMTFQVVTMDPDAGLLRCSNAGHTFPFLIRPAAPGAKPVLQSVTTSGSTLGAGAKVDLDSPAEAPWTPGSRLFLYTDGLVECLVGEKNLYDKKRLRQSVLGSANRAPREQLSQVLADWEGAIGSFQPQDDVTAVLCEAVKG
jgi:sigma-B regulation protein RsbU (phosphoserine phosphatase)